MMSSRPPNKWFAALLGLVAPPVGLLYAGSARWAGVYLCLLVIAAGSIALGAGVVVVGAVSLVLSVAAAIQAWRRAGRWPAGRARPWYSRWYGALAAAVAVGLGVFGLRAFVVEPFSMPSTSMLPGIAPGSVLVVGKWGYGNYGSFGIDVAQRPVSAPIRHGDVIVFEYPPEPLIRYVKRVVGLPGDTVRYRRGQLSINGLAVTRSPVADFMPPDGEPMHQFEEQLSGERYRVVYARDERPFFQVIQDFPLRDNCRIDPEGIECLVPEGHYYVMGDNRDNSSDSRVWGFVPAPRVVGKVLLLLPPRS
ncbi:signal peptidase I [Denitromonas iodatirespirans]|uniref:Signal peptidase I n=1 Tax=Denitromonas iodatirespirans TaxID=2795389 RepID=A0A944DB53_DENI1|nr:signal peptidase I [Denitromonas iodatirespirans]MBT0962112.1 signal peptidase I [Denitromonas iodatirespirans]